MSLAGTSVDIRLVSSIFGVFCGSAVAGNWIKVRDPCKVCPSEGKDQVNRDANRPWRMLWDSVG